MTTNLSHVGGDMRIEDRRSNFLNVVHLGGEVLVLNKSERDLLIRAADLLDKICRTRAKAWHERGFGPTVDHAEEAADDADDYELHSATAYLSEIAHAEEIFWTLPRAKE